MSETPQSSAPKPGSNKPLIIVVVLVLLGGGAWYFLNGPKYKMIENEGDVTFIDYASRKAEMELPDPKGGTAMVIEGEIPTDCAITIDGKPGDITDIAVGDRVRVKAKLEKRRGPDGEKRKHLTPVSVSVLRKGS